MSSLKISKGQVWVAEDGDKRAVVGIRNGIVDYNHILKNNTEGYARSRTLTSFILALEEENAKLDKRSIINQFFNGD